MAFSVVGIVGVTVEVSEVDGEQLLDELVEDGPPVGSVEVTGDHPAEATGLDVVGVATFLADDGESLHSHCEQCLHGLPSQRVSWGFLGLGQ